MFVLWRENDQVLRSAFHQSDPSSTGQLEVANQNSFFVSVGV